MEVEQKSIEGQVQIILNDIIQNVEQFYQLKNQYEQQIKQTIGDSNTLIFYESSVPLTLEQLNQELIDDQKRVKNHNHNNSESESEWSDSSDSDTNITENIDIKKILANESDDEEVKGNPEELFKTKNEVVAKPNMAIIENSEQRLQRFGVIFNGSEKLIEVGKITQIMKDNIIVQSTKHDIVLDLDNLLFTEQREVLGCIDDVIGNVQNPHYVILMDQFLLKQVGKGIITNNLKVYMIEGLSKILLHQHITQLMKNKGCDASNRYDEEVLNENEKDFSDDEKEQQIRQKKNNKDRKTKLDQLEKESQEHHLKGEGKQASTMIGQTSDNQNRKKKIMVVKNENGVLHKLFVKPNKLNEMMKDPSVKIQQVPQQFLQQQIKIINDNQKQYNNSSSNDDFYHHQQQHQQYQQQGQSSNKKQFQNYSGGNKFQKNVQQQNPYQQQQYQNQQFNKGFNNQQQQKFQQQNWQQQPLQQKQNYQYSQMQQPLYQSLQPIIQQPLLSIQQQSTQQQNNQLSIQLLNQQPPIQSQILQPIHQPTQITQQFQHQQLPIINQQTQSIQQIPQQQYINQQQYNLNTDNQDLYGRGNQYQQVQQQQLPQTQPSLEQQQLTQTQNIQQINTVYSNLSQQQQEQILNSLLSLASTNQTTISQLAHQLASQNNQQQLVGKFFHPNKNQFPPDQKGGDMQ